MADSRLRKFFLLCLLGCSLLLAYSAVDQIGSMYASDSVTAQVRLSPWGLTRQQSLLKEDAQLSRQLEYMVWPIEQNALRLALVENLQQQLLLKPLDARLWQRLLHQTSVFQPPLADSSFVLWRTIRFNQWHDRSMFGLLHGCLYLPQQLTVTEVACQRLLATAQGRYLKGAVKPALGISDTVFRELQRRARAKQ